MGTLKIQKAQITILVLNQSPISAVCWGPKNRTNQGSPVLTSKSITYNDLLVAGDCHIFELKASYNLSIHASMCQYMCMHYASWSYIIPLSCAINMIITNFLCFLNFWVFWIQNFMNLLKFLNKFSIHGSMCHAGHYMACRLNVRTAVPRDKRDYH